MWAGNPDRQGEAGAGQLLLQPWARLAGLHAMHTAGITGVEAMQLNVAGLAHIKNTEAALGHTLFLQGTDIKLNALGVGQRIGDNGVLGLSLMAINFGDIKVTTTSLPNGTGATYSPSFFNLGLGYAHTFENKVSVGATLRVISEGTANVSARGVALDAGVQYVNGPRDNFKFGVSLRNIGTPMKFSGEGLSLRLPDPDGNTYLLSYEKRVAKYELPSVLNIGMAYDFYVANHSRITPIINFTSNSFSRDNVGIGLEYEFMKYITLRSGYKLDIGQTAKGASERNVYTGFSAGFSADIPLSKSGNKLGIDYAYRSTQPWSGSHNLGLRIQL